MTPEATNLITKLILHTVTKQNFFECTKSFEDLYQILFHNTTLRLLEDFNIFPIFQDADTGDSADAEINIYDNPDTAGEFSINISAWHGTENHADEYHVYIYHER